MATILFEKYNGGVAFRTSFYTVDALNLAIDGESIIDGVNGVFAPTSNVDEEPSAGETITVRSFEIYIDTTPDSDAPDVATDIMAQRLAKVTTDANDVDDYDILLTDVDPFEVGEVKTLLDDFELTIKNISGAISNVRIVFVCDVVPV